MSDTHDRLRASEDRFRALVEAAPDAIVISRRGVILYVNAAAVALLGYDDPGDLVGKSMSLFLDEAASATMRERIARMQAAGGRPAPLEYPATRRDGTAITAEIASIVMDFEGEPAVLAFARDVTERVRLRAQVAHQDRLASLGLMSAGVAHEINNPLAFMTLAAEMLERRLARGDDPAASVALVAELRNGIERIGAISRDLRHFGKQGDDASAAVPLGEVLDVAERLVAHELRPHVRLRREHGELPAVRGVARRLEQVFVNLLLNARYALGERRDDAEIVVRVDVEAEHVEVRVTDNGSGMPPAVLARIFEPFFTTRHGGGGTGLGLSICHDIILETGGTLTAQSEPGRGTTMRVRLPRARLVDAAVATPPAAQPSPSSEPRQSGEVSRSGVRPRVLVIDDERALVRSVTTLLSDDCEVDAETSSRAGLARLLDGTPYDVVVCDLMMPELTGIDLYEEVARAHPGAEARFVFVTGGAYTGATRNFLTRVPNAFVLKPFSGGDLLAAVRRVAATDAPNTGAAAATRRLG